MRYLYLFCVVIILFNCEDKQSKKNNVNTVINKDSIESTPTKKKKIIEEPLREFPLLTDKNAMDFFLKYEEENKEDKVRITTDFGEIEILLYDKTKFHRANFIFLTKQNYFDGTQFYRVINNFVVQGGNSDDNITSRKRNEIGRYLLPTDTKRGYKHDRGVISMPSSDIENPYKLASPFEFFIVQQRGGAHFLDGDYTIFGKVTRGMDVVDKIAAVKTDEADWPLQNVYIRKAQIIE